MIRGLSGGFMKSCSHASGRSTSLALDVIDAIICSSTQGGGSVITRKGG
jgi:hypothetical protein